MSTQAEAWEKNPNCQQCKRKLSPAELKRGDRICAGCLQNNKGKVWGNDKDDVYTEATEVAILIATPKPNSPTHTKGFYKIGNDVYTATLDVGTDTNGHPMDKRWESSFTHFDQFWSSVYAKWFDKTPDWSDQLTEQHDELWDIVKSALTHFR